jgi:O-antigen/teichoic acid export membrane protein
MVWALAVTSIPGLLAPMVARVIFPALSRTEEPAQIDVFRPLFRGLLFVGLPIVAATIACAEPLTTHVLGTKWLDGVSLLRLESVTTTIGLAFTPMFPLLFLALPPRRVKWMMVSTTFTIAILAIGLAPFASYRAISIAGIATGAVILGLTETQLRHARGYSMFRDMLPGLIGLVSAVGLGLLLASWPHNAFETIALAGIVAVTQAALTALLGGGIDPRKLLRGPPEKVAQTSPATMSAGGV